MMFLNRGEFGSLAAALCIVSSATVGSAQSQFARQGGEFGVTGSLVGDQVHPSVSINQSGGYMVWEDNHIDGHGSGISARRLDATLTGSLGVFRVNVDGEGDQRNPKVALLNEGGAAVVWEDGDDIFARFVGNDGAFRGGDIRVNTYRNDLQEDPSVTVLENGTVVVVWASMGQDRDLHGVYGQRFSADGQPLGGEFAINQSIFYNQRNPAIAALDNGDFVVAWVSESFRSFVDFLDEDGHVGGNNAGGLTYNVDIYGRIFDGDGHAKGNEFRINELDNHYANPSIAGGTDGKFTVVFSGNDSTIKTISQSGPSGYRWDIYGRVIDGNGNAVTGDFVVNDHRNGDQYVPTVSTDGDGAVVVWTSLAQDGHYEGVFGQRLGSDGSKSGDEFQVNTTFRSKQIWPTIASDRGNRHLVAWSSFGGGIESFDVMAQRYSTFRDLPEPEPPMVFGTSYRSLSVTWPTMDGYDVASYLLYLDGNTTPVTVTNNRYTFDGLAPESPYDVRLAYMLSDGRTSPVSGSATGETWSWDNNFDGLPDGWQVSYWGEISGSWPGGGVDSDGDGASNLDELLAGTDPMDGGDVLRTDVIETSQGLRLQWNTKSGLLYQVQVSTDATSWLDAGQPRFAVGDIDSIPINNNDGVGVFRIILLR